MLVKLKEFPNNARVVWSGCEWIKRASKLKDHFCLVEVAPEKETPTCLYLHRDTFVEPIISTTEL